MEVLLQASALLAALAVCAFTRNALFSCLAFGICAAFMLAVSLVSRLSVNRQIEALTAYLMRVQDSLELPAPEKCREGKLGILQSEIYKLVVLLNEQTAEAQKGREYLADMLSDISHQLKTPLAGITILTDLLKNPDLPQEKRREFADKINAQADRAAWFIKNLLALSQIEAGVLKLKAEKTDGQALLREVCAPFEVMAELKDVTLSLSAPSGAFLLCDRHWTAEALSNIVKNCLEHTPSKGAVYVKLEQNNFSTDITIRDTGEGIKKEQLPHIFERFYKADNAGRDSVGIGLAMAKQILLLQNGDITAKSRPGEGTAFFIKLYRMEG